MQLVAVHTNACAMDRPRTLVFGEHPARDRRAGCVSYVVIHPHLLPSMLDNLIVTAIPIASPPVACYLIPD